MTRAARGASPASRGCRRRECDGIELVLEHAGLTSSERMVIRPALAGDDARTIAAESRPGARDVSVAAYA